MGYALFANNKLVLNSELNTVQLMQTQRSDEQFALATQTMSLQRQLSARQSSQAGELSDLYDDLVNAPDERSRQIIEWRIAQLELKHQRQLEAINNQIYAVGVKENAIELEVKALDTQVSVLQQKLEAVQQAEGKGIQNATPKFGGLS